VEIDADLLHHPADEEIKANNAECTERLLGIQTAAPSLFTFTPDEESAYQAACKENWLRPDDAGHRWLWIAARDYKSSCSEECDCWVCRAMRMSGS